MDANPALSFNGNHHSNLEQSNNELNDIGSHSIIICSNSTISSFNNNNMNSSSMQNHGFSLPHNNHGYGGHDNTDSDDDDDGDDDLTFGGNRSDPRNNNDTQRYNHNNHNNNNNNGNNHNHSNNNNSLNQLISRLSMGLNSKVTLNGDNKRHLTNANNHIRNSNVHTNSHNTINNDYSTHTNVIYNINITPEHIKQLTGSKRNMVSHDFYEPPQKRHRQRITNSPAIKSPGHNTRKETEKMEYTPTLISNEIAMFDNNNNNGDIFDTKFESQTLTNIMEPNIDDTNMESKFETKDYDEINESDRDTDEDDEKEIVMDDKTQSDNEHVQHLGLIISFRIHYDSKIFEGDIKIKNIIHLNDDKWGQIKQIICDKIEKEDAFYVEIRDEDGKQTAINHIQPIVNIVSKHNDKNDNGLIHFYVKTDKNNLELSKYMIKTNGNWTCEFHKCKKVYQHKHKLKAHLLNFHFKNKNQREQHDINHVNYKDIKGDKFGYFVGGDKKVNCNACGHVYDNKSQWRSICLRKYRKNGNIISCTKK